MMDQQMRVEELLFAQSVVVVLIIKGVKGARISHFLLTFPCGRRHHIIYAKTFRLQLQPLWLP